MTAELGKKHLVIVLVVFAVVFIVYSSLGDKGFLRLNRMVRHRDDLRARVESLEKANMGLAMEIHLLRDDPSTIESLARTDLGLVRPGEVIYVFPEETEEALK